MCVSLFTFHFQELPGRPYLRHASGDFWSVDREPPGRLPPSGPHEAYPSPTRRVDADENLSWGNATRGLARGGAADPM